jgi:hypothetical protein
MTRRLFSVLLLFVAIFLIALSRYRPPEPKGLDAPPGAFSALRARETQRVISESGKPRDLGSDANAAARAWLQAELAKSGFTTEIQTAMSCTRHGACGRVANVIATRPGREPSAQSILLMAHHDSVPCSPGGSDDGMGTSTVIEAARAIGAAPPLRRRVVIVLTDGEESGLLGAEAFVNQHPLATSIGGIVNVDARGSRGPSAMFETSPGNSWVVGLLARRAERPVTSSLFYEIYRRMPNDTDFTTVKGRGHGVNFANIAGVETYHTPLDSFAAADPGTLQHHGDQALAMVRALAESGAELDSPRTTSQNAVWFDVLASFVVRWPATASPGLAVLAFCLVLGWTIRMRAFGLGLLTTLAALLAALAASLLVGIALRYGGAIPVPWVAHPVAALLSLHTATIGAGLAAARIAARRSSPQVLWAGTWLTWGALGVVTALVAPGACFLFVVPTFVAGFLAWLEIDLAAAVPALVAAVLWMPIAILAYDGLGLAVPPLVCISSTLLVTTLPALGARPEGSSGARTDRRLGLGAAAFAVLLALVATVVPVYSAEVPQRVNVVFRQDEPNDGTPPIAHVYVEAAWAYMPWGKPPEAMVRALGDPSKVGRGSTLPWFAQVPVAEVPRIEVEAPKAVVLASKVSARGWSARARVASSRGARTLVLLLPPERAVAVRVEGQAAMVVHDAVVLRAVPADGIEIALDALGEKPIPITLLDVASGLPPASVAPVAQAVLGARDARAVQTQEGDLTISSRRIDL